MTLACQIGNELDYVLVIDGFAFNEQFINGGILFSSLLPCSMSMHLHGSVSFSNFLIIIDTTATAPLFFYGPFFNFSFVI